MSTPLRRSIGVVVLLLAAAQAVAVAPNDGWARWTTPAVADAPAFCCGDVRGGGARTIACKLDGNIGMYGTFDNARGNGTLQVYAHHTAGTIDRVRIYDGACPVTAKANVAELGELGTSDSLARLLKAPAAKAARSHEMTSAIALHPGPQAYQWLEARSRSDAAETRRDALFWIANARLAEGSARLKAALHDEPVAKLRAAAVFPVAHAELPQRDTWLLAAARNDTSTEVRREAWFWIAQRDRPGAASQLRSALKQERDDDVLEHIVFSISQLDEPAGIDGLIAVVEDRALARKLRERALFWLAQSEDERAFAYLDKRLTATR